MRPFSLSFACGLLIGLLPFGLAADPVMPDLRQYTDLEYRLGGAATEAARVPTQRYAPGSTWRLVPLRYPETLDETVTMTRTDLGDFSFFGEDDVRSGQEVLRLGTALTRGPATAGFAVLYDDGADAGRSEVFVDFALSTRLRVGLAGILRDRESGSVASPSSLDISAAYATDAGTFVQGGITHAPNANPVFGLSLGLRF